MLLLAAANLPHASPRNSQEADPSTPSEKRAKHTAHYPKLPKHYPEHQRQQADSSTPSKKAPRFCSQSATPSFGGPVSSRRFVASTHCRSRASGTSAPALLQPPSCTQNAAFIRAKGECAPRPIDFKTEKRACKTTAKIIRCDASI